MKTIGQQEENHRKTMRHRTIAEGLSSTPCLITPAGNGYNILTKQLTKDARHLNLGVAVTLFLSVLKKYIKFEVGFFSVIVFVDLLV